MSTSLDTKKRKKKREQKNLENHRNCYYVNTNFHSKNEISFSSQTDKEVLATAWEQLL